MGSLTKGTSVAGPRPCTGAPGTPTCSAPPPLHFVTFAPLTLQTHHMCLCLPETVRPSFVPESAFLSSKALQSLMEKFSLQIWVGLVGTGLQVPPWPWRPACFRSPQDTVHEVGKPCAAEPWGACRVRWRNQGGNGWLHCEELL